MEYYVSERCIDDDLCPNHLTPATPCQRGKFHGNATGLEVASAKVLFTKNRNDKECRFKYTTYVGDGDSAVGKEVLNDPDVKKEECQYHYRKSCKRNLVKVFNDSVAWIAKKRRRNRETKRLLKKSYYAR